MDKLGYIKMFKNIGERMLCLEEEFQVILPNYPTLRGSEFIFTISWADAGMYIDSEVEYLVRGLHIVELLYRNKTQNDFGFGSPSPTYKIIKQLENKNKTLANELHHWIAANGGNYYIKPMGSDIPLNEY